jgi:GNAT superfamily N-acetyltransferase
MTDFGLVTAADIPLTQGLAQRVTAIRPDLISAGAPFGELAWVWGQGRAACGAAWPRALWFSGDELVAWAWAEPVGTHPGYRRRGLARTMMLHGMHLARAAGASHATVVCKGAPGHPAARGLYYGLGFRELSRDVPLIKPRTAG